VLGVVCRHPSDTLPLQLGQFFSFVHQASVFAFGFAVVGVDLPHHCVRVPGSRRLSSSDFAVEAPDFFGVEVIPPFLLLFLLGPGGLFPGLPTHLSQRSPELVSGRLGATGFAFYVAGQQRGQ